MLSKIAKKWLLFGVVLFAATLNTSWAYAEEGIIEEYPDAVLCMGTSDAFVRVYYVQGMGSGTVNYFHGGVLVRFNYNGSFNAGTPASDCDGQSLSQLLTAEKAFYLRNDIGSGGGSSVESGQMAYFNLVSCPSTWTQQIQLDRTINPDSPMVLCRKD